MGAKGAAKKHPKTASAEIFFFPANGGVAKHSQQHVSSPAQERDH